jgi:hypothetical protein
MVRRPQTVRAVREACGAVHIARQTPRIGAAKEERREGKEERRNGQEKFSFFRVPHAILVGYFLRNNFSKYFLMIK